MFAKILTALGSIAIVWVGLAIILALMPFIFVFIGTWWILVWLFSRS